MDKIIKSISNTQYIAKTTVDNKDAYVLFASSRKLMPEIEFIKFDSSTKSIILRGFDVLITPGFKGLYNTVEQAVSASSEGVA